MIMPAPDDAIWFMTRAASGPSGTFSTTTLSTLSPKAASIASRPSSSFLAQPTSPTGDG